MRSIATSVILILTFATNSLAQSESFKTLRDKFEDSENVFCLRTSGFLTRSVLAFAGERDFKNAMRDVKSIRMMVIPHDAFREKNVTLSGFQKFAESDSFEPLLKVRDDGDDVTLLVQHGDKKDDPRYLVLIDNDHEVVVLEVRGRINERLMFKDSHSVTYIN